MYTVPQQKLKEDALECNNKYLRMHSDFDEEGIDDHAPADS